MFTDPNQTQYYGQQGYNSPSPGFYPAQGGYQPSQGFPQPGFQQPQGIPQTGFSGYPQGMPATVPFHMPIPPQQGGDETIKGFQFSDETIRKAFIRKVYSILMVLNTK